jgi:hypothetical protein
MHLTHVVHYDDDDDDKSLTPDKIEPLSLGRPVCNTDSTLFTLSHSSQFKTLFRNFMGVPD